MNDSPYSNSGEESGLKDHLEGQSEIADQLRAGDELDFVNQPTLWDQSIFEDQMSLDDPTDSEDQAEAAAAARRAGTDSEESFEQQVVDGTVEDKKVKSKTRDSKRRRKLVIAAVLGVLALIGIAYGVLWVLVGDLTPRNATVRGIHVGGLSAEDAENKLREAFEAQSKEKITLIGDDKTVTIDPVEAGLSIDYAATVTATGERSWNPIVLWKNLTGGGETDLVVVYDETDLTGSLNEVATQFAVQGTNAAITLEDAKATLVPATQTVALDVPATIEILIEEWPSKNPIEVTITRTDPEFTTAEAQNLIDETITPALSGPVTLTVNIATVTVTPEMIASAMVIDPATATATLDPAKLEAAAKPAIDELGFDKAKDASFVFQDGKPVVVPSVTGITIKPEDLAEAVSEAMVKTTDRTATVEVVTQEPAFTTEMANAAGVKEITGEFTTYYPYAEYRNNNLGLMAKAINGYYLAPGETFSYNEVLGERTEARGYMSGYVIKGGKLVKAVGGGVSQGATTTFNAAFFAGLELVEHHPHTMYFDRYPAGREATVYWGSLDLRFKNDTEYGVLMQAYVNPASSGGRGSVTVKIWSTKTYDEVRSTEPKKSNFGTVKTVTQSGSDCVPQDGAQGFDVSYSRIFIKDGKQVKKEDYFWRYTTSNRIVCE